MSSRNRIDTQEFVERLVQEGVSSLFYVPCNYGQSLINAALSSRTIRSVPCASEAIAYSAAFGETLAGGKPVLFCQSAGFPNVINGLVTLGHAYKVYFPIITSWRAFTPGSAEIQHRFLASNLDKVIEATGCVFEDLGSETERAANRIQVGFDQPVVFYVTKSSLNEVVYTGKQCGYAEDIPSRCAYLQEIKQQLQGPGVCFVGTTGHTSREAFGFVEPLFMMVGNMGGGVALASGLTRKFKRVVFLGGDAEFVMHMGGLTTIARDSGGDGQLLYLLLDNKQNKSTGGQPTFQDHVNYSAVAAACGWSAYPVPVCNLTELRQVLASAGSIRGNYFVHVQCTKDDTMQRPTEAEILGLVARLRSCGGGKYVE